MDGTHAVVTWVYMGVEHKCEGELCLVTPEQVIVMIGPKAICCIPAIYRPQIDPPTAVPNAGNSDLSIRTPATTPAKSAAVNGHGDCRDISGVVITEWGY